MADKITTFTDLDTWRKGHELVLLVYTLTKSFPADERFALIDQLRRAVVSVTSNIAEGFGRKGDKERIQFYSLARGSLAEVQNQIIVAKDLGYLSVEDFERTWTLTIDVYKLLNGLLRSIRSASC